ncbi:MAG: hypothetical protein JXL84_26295 [Deltaproteobacteria bacterium]|nr:hypothetical protein [Deltaproteobacteria bacterium]
MVKREMGPDAVILRTQTLHAPGKGRKREQKIEVTAAIDYEAAGEKSPPGGSVRFEGILQEWHRMEGEFRELREVILSGSASGVIRPEVYFSRAIRTRYMHLLNFGLRPEVIREVIDECHEQGGRQRLTETKLILDTLSRVVTRINVDMGKDEGPVRRIYSFIGPTGVGKTTTLAKLAALRAVQQGKRAALITIDTFRIAAVAQLQTYARIMGIPLEVAVSPEDLRRALNKHRRCDYVFIDTAGRSPNHEKGIAELKALFQVPEDIHHYLVLSATARYRNLLHADDRFGELPIRSTIFTKLDETQDASSMVNFLIARKRPISYLTTGQQVPEDIEPASRRKMASILLRGVKSVEDHPTNEVSEYGSGERT